MKFVKAIVIAYRTLKKNKSLRPIRYFINLIHLPSYDINFLYKQSIKEVR